MHKKTDSTKHILLGVTGGIAAYKTPELIRLLTKQGHTVQVVMTEAAQQFVTATTLQAVSGNPIFTNQWDTKIANGMPHIELSRMADVILIAPASADFIAKLAHGFANDLLSTLCLARECPLLIAPAMNKQMWENLATQRNVKQLIDDGVQVLGPDSGEQACGEIGQGRMLEPEALIAAMRAHFTPKLLAGKKILLTAGATIEMLDPVRGLTNLSSGKMGFAIAQMAQDMGAQVTLVHGLSSTPIPPVSHITSVRSASEMYQAVMLQIADQDIFVAVAAVADYRPASISDQKIKKSESTLTMEFIRNKDILAEVASLPQPPYCVGFAAETEQVVEYAKQKRLNKRIPMIVANHASSAMGEDENQITIIDDTGEHAFVRAEKATVALQLLTYLKSRLDSL